MSDNKREAVSPSRPLTGSADAPNKNAERKPPGYRHIHSCENCAHRLRYRAIDGDIFCKLYEYHTTAEMICDSYD